MLLANSSFRVINTVISFFISVVFLRLVGVEGFGLFSLFIVNAVIFNLITSFGSDAGIGYHVASRTFSPKRVRQIVQKIIIFQLVIFLFIELANQFAGTDFSILEGDGWLVFIVSLVYVVSISAIEKYSSFLNGLQLYTLCSKILLSSNLISLFVFLVLYLVSPDKSVLTYIGIYVGLSAVQAIALVIAVFTNSSRPVDDVREQEISLKKFFGYSVLTMITNSIQFIAYRIDFWFLNYYRDEVHVGWYALGVKIVQSFWILPVVLSSIIFPMIASNHGKGILQSVERIVRIAFWLSLCAAGLSVLVIPKLLPYLFGKEFMPSVSVFFVLLPGVLLFGVATIFAAYYAGVNRLKVNLMGSVLCLLVILVLDIFLIPQYGMYGAAIASTIGYGLTGVYYVIRFMSDNNRGIFSIMILTKDDISVMKRSIVRIIKRRFL